jgi:hypothetical protein
MTRALDWNPRWVTIMSVNSRATSTLDISKVPEIMLPRPPDQGRAEFRVPELEDSDIKLRPSRFNPAELLKCGHGHLSQGQVSAVGKGTHHVADWPMENPFRVALLNPSWVFNTMDESLVNWVQPVKSTAMARGEAAPFVRGMEILPVGVTTVPALSKFMTPLPTCVPK